MAACCRHRTGRDRIARPGGDNGYLDDPAANQNALHNGWFRTGDLGWLDADGELFITGRIREIINRGGEKILPHEIDVVAAEHPAVEQAAAFAIPHPTLGGRYCHGDCPAPGGGGR